MKQILLLSLLAVSPLIISSCASDSSPASDSGTVTYGAAEQSLLDALNASRTQSGKKPLPVSAKLTKLARAESGSAAAAAKFGSNNTDGLRLKSGFNSLGKLQGTLKDRGPQTGAGFLEYWKKDPAETLSGDWTHVGVAISKSTDGRLFAILLLGGDTMSSGASLMTPAMSPGGL